MRRTYLLIAGFLTCATVSTVFADTLRKDFNACRNLIPDERLACYESILVDSPVVIDGSTEGSYLDSINEMAEGLNGFEYNAFKKMADVVAIKYSYSEESLAEAKKRQRVELDGLSINHVFRHGEKISDEDQRFRSDLAVYDVSAKPDGDGGAEIDFKLKNNGDRVFSDATVTILFKDSAGSVIFEDEFSAREYRHPSIKLKPNYVWVKRKRRDLSISRVPSEWNQGPVEARVTSVSLDYKSG